MKLAIAHSRMGLGKTLGTRTAALGLAASLVAPGLMAGCGGGQQQAAAPGGYRPAPGMQNPAMQAQRPGMSTRNKVLLLGGAALAYYLYQKKRNAQNQPLPRGVQMYRSRNGGIYYRDPRNPQQVIYVVPPASQQFNRTLQVDPSEVQGLGLERYQGYGGANNGIGLDDVRNLIPLR